MHNTTEQLNAATNVVVDPPVSPATVTITEESLIAMIQAATQAAVEGLMTQVQASTVVANSEALPVTGQRQTTKPEACTAHKLLTVLDQRLSKVIVGTRDHVVVPMNIWAVDKAAPQGLAAVAAGSVIAALVATKVGGYFARLAESATAKSLALTAQ